MYLYSSETLSAFAVNLWDSRYKHRNRIYGPLGSTELNILPTKTRESYSQLNVLNMSIILFDPKV